MVNVQLGTYISQSCPYANVSTLNKCTLWVVYLAAHLYCQDGKSYRNAFVHQTFNTCQAVLVPANVSPCSETVIMTAA